MTTLTRMNNEQKEKPRKDWGVIYIITCIPSMKSYIGQANNYISGSKPHGTDDRWREHVYEAYHHCDKCILLENAIRKYGKNAFLVKTICHVPCKELNDLETHYIESFDTVTPNGYNLTKGGQAFKPTKETRMKQSKTRTGMKLSTGAAYSIKLASLGRICKKSRKYSEDTKLPKYIIAKRKNGKIFGYSVCFPTGITKRENVQKAFFDTDSPKYAYVKAIKFLNILKEKYKDRLEKIEAAREENRKNHTKKNLYEKALAKCPKYVYPIMTKEHRVSGFYVEGFPDTANGVYPKKTFTELSSNNKNKLAAIRYVSELKMKNINAQFDHKEIFDDEYIGKRGQMVTLPKYITILRDRKHEIIGYCINGFPIAKGKYIGKKFGKPKYTMEEKFKQAISCLEQLRKKYTYVSN
jgi:hypothetical protein